MPDIPTVCTRGCPDACQMWVGMEEGRAMRLSGDAGNPYTQGRLCAAQERYLERVYHPRRVLHPHVRRGEGSTAWVRSDIPSILADLAGRVTRTIAEDGPLSILHIQGDSPTALTPRLNRMFFRLLGGVSTLVEDPSQSPGGTAFRQDFGAIDHPDPREVLNSRLILLWSPGLSIQDGHWTPLLSHARRLGARIVLVDPFHSRTAKLADAYYQPRPGTEGHLALALAGIIVRNGWTDAPFLKAAVANAPEFLSVAQAAKVELLCAQCDLSISSVENLARLTAATKPMAMILGPSFDEHPSGAQAVRLINAVSALTGQPCMPGGGVYFRNTPKGFDLSFIENVPVRRERPLDLAEIMEERPPSDPPIRMVFINRANPVSTLPQGTRFWKFLRKIPTVVLFDRFFTDTADAATHFLPTTSILEEDELAASPWHKGIGMGREILAPRREARSEFFWYRHLARRLELKELDKPVGYFMNLMAGPLRACGCSLESLAARMILNPLESRVAWSDRFFPTPTGRIELITHTNLELPSADPMFPLTLIPVIRPELLLDQALDEEAEGLPPATVHPQTLEALKLEPGREATVVSASGRLRVRLEADPFQRKDVLLIPRGHSTLAERNVMSLIPFQRTSVGTGVVTLGTLVRPIP